jgi:signal transduction histidine kinase
MATIIPCIIGFSYLVTHFSELYRSQVADNLESLSIQVENRIQSSFQQVKTDINLITAQSELQSTLQNYQIYRSPQDLALLQQIIQNVQESDKAISSITIYDEADRGLVTTLPILPRIHDKNTLRLAHYSLTIKDNTTVIVASAPLYLGDEYIGTLQITATPNFIDEINQSNEILGDTGEWIIALRNEENNAVFVTPTRYGTTGEYFHVVDSQATRVPITQALLSNETVLWDAIDYNGNSVVAATRHLGEYDIGIVAKIHSSEVFSEVDRVVEVFWWVLAGIMTLLLVIGSVLAFVIVKPIEALTKSVMISKTQTPPDFNDQSLWYEVNVLAREFTILQLHNTELKESLEDKIHQATQSLEETNTKLLIEKDNALAATEAKTVFLANMSHEVRTPLNSIYGALQIIERQQTSEKIQKLVTTANNSMRTLLSLVNDILDFSKIENHALELEHVPINVFQIANELVSELGASVEGRNLEIIVDKTERYNEGWIGDSLRVRQVISNFLSNAIKFTNDGSVTVLLDCQVQNGQLCLVITVRDTGIGMSQEFINNLFKRFHQESVNTARKFGGTGLGMSINHALVKLMHGEIRVVSTLDEGTQVTTILPLPQVALEEVALPKTEKVSAPDLSGIHILLAEDNKINQEIFCAMLEDTGAKVTLANNGRDAVEKVKSSFDSNKLAFDMVFLDIYMPVMGGVQACCMIKKCFPKLPLVSITANVSPSDISYYKDQGFEHHISKPIEISTLYKLLNSLGRGYAGH